MREAAHGKLAFIKKRSNHDYYIEQDVMTFFG